MDGSWQSCKHTYLCLLKSAMSNAEYSRLLQNTLNLCNEKDDDGDYGDISGMLLQLLIHSLMLVLTLTFIS